MASDSLAEFPIVQRLLQHPLPSPSQQQKEAESEWRDRALKMTEMNLKAILGPLAELDAHLTLRSYIAGYTLSKADLLVWGVLRGNRVARAYVKQGLMINLSRWFSYIEESEPWIAEEVLAASVAQMAVKDENNTDEGGNFEIGLKDTDKGVVTRFPPEPSGYLHIGHAKAALLNDYFAHKKYKGTLILRFDDTNPVKEKQEFEDSIIYDLELMGIKPDKVTHTSDWFKELYEYCIQMLKEGTAYADDTPREVLKKERWDGIKSKCRDATPAENLEHFGSMTAGTEEGQRWYIRAKISVDDTNKALRDPVIYRCSPQAHHRTGDTWKVYPTYDFCCPVVDALEGVTHALRTTEYKDRDAQYQWFITALRLRHVYNWDFSRLNFVRTLLSKRKLTKFVDEGAVWGWDDPRMPTVRGIRRRGMTVPALQEYIIKQGPSRNVVSQDWTTIWATNKKYIDPIAARFTAIAKADAVQVTIAGAPAAPHTADVEKHAKYDLGTKRVTYSGAIIMEQADAQTLADGEEITLMNWGNAIVRSITRSANLLDGVVSDAGTAAPDISATSAAGEVAGANGEAGARKVTGVELELHLQGDVKRTKKKLTWLSTDQELTPVELVDFDYLITKDKLEDEDDVKNFMTPRTEFREEAWADANVAALSENDVMQFDRKGYFRVDRPFLHGKPAVLFQIPTGKTK